VDQSAKGSESRLNPDPARDVVQTSTTPRIASGTQGGSSTEFRAADMSAISADGAGTDSKIP